MLLLSLIPPPPPFPQALPYVCLLIAMLFFIYAIIGMQVTISALTVTVSNPALSLWFGVQMGYCLLSRINTQLRMRERLFLAGAREIRSANKGHFFYPHCQVLC